MIEILHRIATALIDLDLNEWEQKFCRDMYERINKQQPLTDRQTAKLEQILADEGSDLSWGDFET